MEILLVVLSTGSESLMLILVGPASINHFKKMGLIIYWLPIVEHAGPPLHDQRYNQGQGRSHCGDEKRQPQLAKKTHDSVLWACGGSRVLLARSEGNKVVTFIPTPPRLRPKPPELPTYWVLGWLTLRPCFKLGAVKPAKLSVTILREQATATLTLPICVPVRGNCMSGCPAFIFTGCLVARLLWKVDRQR